MKPTTMSGKRKVIVNSGAFLTQLKKYVGEFEGDPLLSSRFDIENPEAVIRVQLDFLENGSQIILTNTYQATIDGFMKHLNLSKDEAIERIRKSVRVTKAAKARFLEKNGDKVEPGFPLVFATIGAYGAYLHDFSEYSGSYAKQVTTKQLQEWHRSRIDICLEEGVDGLAFMTIPCQIEAEALVDLMLNEYPECKFYLSYQCKDQKCLASGESFPDAVSAIWKKLEAKSATDRCYAIGINCVNPRNVAGLLKSISPTERDVIPLGVLSNKDQVFNSSNGQWEDNEGPRPVVSFIPEWIDLGVKIIGGGCGVMADDIAKIRQYVDDFNARNV